MAQKPTLQLPQRIFSPYQIRPSSGSNFSWSQTIELLWIREELATNSGRQPRTITELTQAQRGWQILRISGSGAVRHFRSMRDFCYANFDAPVLAALLDLQNWKIIQDQFEA